jgi:hypothetical protein
MAGFICSSLVVGPAAFLRARKDAGQTSMRGDIIEVCMHAGALYFGKDSDWLPWKCPCSRAVEGDSGKAMHTVQSYFLCTLVHREFHKCSGHVSPPLM